MDTHTPKLSCNNYIWLATSKLYKKKNSKKIMGKVKNAFLFSQFCLYPFSFESHHLIFIYFNVESCVKNDSIISLFQMIQQVNPCYTIPTLNNPDKDKNIEGKDENAGEQHFLVFSQHFFNPFLNDKL